MTSGEVTCKCPLFLVVHEHTVDMVVAQACQYSKTAFIQYRDRAGHAHMVSSCRVDHLVGTENQSCMLYIYTLLYQALLYLLSRCDSDHGAPLQGKQGKQVGAMTSPSWILMLMEW